MAIQEPLGKVVKGRVADDGSVIIPPEEVREMALGPGEEVQAELRVIRGGCHSIRGALKGWPDISWDDFDRASRLAQQDLNAGQ